MKRGLTESTLIGLILAIAGGLVLASVIGSLLTKGGDKVDLDLCRSNVQVAATAAQLLQVTKCHTKPLGILEVKVPKNYKDEISQQIAKAVYECDYQFGETPNLPWKGNYLWPTSVVCFVCSTFQLPDKGVSLATADLTAWMKTHNDPQASSYLDQVLPRLPLKDSRNLVVESFGNEIITPIPTSTVRYDGPIKTEMRIHPAEKLSPGKQYATISYGSPERRFSQTASFVSQESATAAKTLGELTDGEISSIFITDFDAISKNCDITFVRYP